MRRTGQRKRDRWIGVLQPEPVKAHLNLDDDAKMNPSVERRQPQERS
jgi:hypothetical protein